MQGFILSGFRQKYSGPGGSEQVGDPSETLDALVLLHWYFVVADGSSQMSELPMGTCVF